jgi:hypothetical protein
MFPWFVTPFRQLLVLAAGIFRKRQEMISGIVCIHHFQALNRIRRTFGTRGFQHRLIAGFADKLLFG